MSELGETVTPQKYISHHLNHLQIDLHTFQLIHQNSAASFWILNIDSMVVSVLLGVLFLLMFTGLPKKPLA